MMASILKKFTEFIDEYKAAQKPIASNLYFGHIQVGHG